ncbi:MAG: FAD-dependent monooxygenase [Vicingaceae bacterium]
MNQVANNYDIAIIGGGLAGLATAIEQTSLGRKVILFEKKQYPFHKVCGEYISNEAWNYLEYLGLALKDWDLPQITQLKVSSAQGNELNQPLKKGGFGISRYFLDHQLFQLAQKKGVEVHENTEITELEFENDQHILKFDEKIVCAKLVVGSFGKRSKLDRQLDRNHMQITQARNYIGVKYHIKAALPANLIGLHLFKNGYCGISKVEGTNNYCLCYLTLASELKNCNNSIEELENKVLSKNKYLKEYLSYERIYEAPEVIAQLNFKPKRSIEKHVFMLGDAAGLITPLCGNGMSMALCAAHGFSQLSENYFSNKINRSQLEKQYQEWWKGQFGFRLKAGRLLQHLFYQPALLNPALRLLSRAKGLSNFLIALTHGKDILK